MHSERLRVDQTDAGLSIMRVSDLRAYLDRLIDNLDDSSLRAVLKLMICEGRSAVLKQQQLIALERLDGREAAGRTDRLRELETVQHELTAVYAIHGESEDEDLDEDAPQVSPVEEPVPSAPTSAPTSPPTRTATAPNVHALRRLGIIGKEQGDDVGRFSVAAPEGEIARAEPAAVRNRQGRHGARPAR
jgi:hypothetical protein